MKILELIKKKTGKIKLEKILKILKGAMIKTGKFLREAGIKLIELLKIIKDWLVKSIKIIKEKTAKLLEAMRARIKEMKKRRMVVGDERKREEKERGKGKEKEREEKRKKKILIVEDDGLLLDIISERLSDEKFEVLEERDGLKAIDVAKQSKPDLILSNLILPGIDGFAVLRELKSEKTTKDIPVVIFSNLDDPSDIKSAKVLGAEEYFIKTNTSLEELVDFIQKNYG